MPSLAARMVKRTGLMGSGDTQQLQPVVMSQPGTNPYASALGLSWMFRLIRQGFPHVILTEQSRMVPEISALVNELAYNNVVQDNIKTLFEHRGYATAFSKVIQDGTKPKKQFILFLDVMESDAVVVACTSNNSRYREFYVKLLINCLEDLLKKTNNDSYRGATVAVVTAYKAQLALPQKALSAMICAGVPGTERVELHTVDSCQGHQFDFVLLDILIASSAGFLSKLRRRNVTLSRAKNDMIIISSTAHLRKAEGNFKQKRHLRKLFDLLLPYRREKATLATVSSASITKIRRQFRG